MFRRLIIFLGLLLFLLIAAASWNIRQAGKPMNADEIPQWELVQETQDSILLQSVAEPDRKTEAFLAGPSCLLYTSPSPRDVEESRMPSSA